MIQEVTESDFINGFKECGREENFTFLGRRSMYQFFKMMEEDIDESLLFDPIAICCEFTEYESLDEINQAYGINLKTLDELGELTIYIAVDRYNLDIDEYELNGIIIQDW